MNAMLTLSVLSRLCGALAGSLTSVWAEIPGLQFLDLFSSLQSLDLSYNLLAGSLPGPCPYFQALSEYHLRQQPALRNRLACASQYTLCVCHSHLSQYFCTQLVKLIAVQILHVRGSQLPTTSYVLQGMPNHGHKFEILVCIALTPCPCCRLDQCKQLPTAAAD